MINNKTIYKNAVSFICGFSGKNAKFAKNMQIIFFSTILFIGL